MMNDSGLAERGRNNPHRKALVWVVLIAPVLLCMLGVLVCKVRLEDQRRYDQQKLAEARTVVDRAVAELPKLKDFEIVKELNYDVFDLEHGPGSCYLARAYFVVGTQLPLPVALEVNAKQLETLGWVPSGTKYTTSIYMERGSKEGEQVFSGNPGDELAAAVDYVQIRKVYPNIMFLRLDYGLQASC
jgi:hypothetical protein